MAFMIESNIGEGMLGRCPARSSVKPKTAVAQGNLALSKTFSNRLRDKGLVAKKSVALRGWQGIRLVAEANLSSFNESNTFEEGII